MKIDPNITFDSDHMTLRFYYSTKAGMFNVCCDKTVDLEPMAQAIEDRIEQRIVERLKAEGN